MALDFPSSPTVGQIFTDPASGLSWRWDGVKWMQIAAAGSGPFVAKSGDTMTGLLLLSADPSAALGAVTKQYSDTKLPLAGGTLTGAVTVPAITYSGPVTSVNGLVAAISAQLGLYWNSTTAYMSLYVNGALNDTIPYGYSGGSFYGVTRLGFSLTNLQGYAVNGNGNGFYIAVTSASDRKFKTGIKAAGAALDAVNALRVREFDLKQPGRDEEHWDFGLIADEVEAVAPRAFVAADPALPDSFQSLRELPLVAMLVKAVQELTARVAALEGVAET